MLLYMSVPFDIFTILCKLLSFRLKLLLRLDTVKLLTGWSATDNFNETDNKL